MGVCYHPYNYLMITSKLLTYCYYISYMLIFSFLHFSFRTYLIKWVYY